MSGKHKGSIEHRFGGRVSIPIPQRACKEWLALSIQCFERRHKDCHGKCEPFEPSTTCECVCHELADTPSKDESPEGN